VLKPGKAQGLGVVLLQVHPTRRTTNSRPEGDFCASAANEIPQLLFTNIPRSDLVRTISVAGRYGGVDAIHRLGFRSLLDRGPRPLAAPSEQSISVTNLTPVLFAPEEGQRREF
jgi:hypothetical protein